MTIDSPLLAYGMQSSVQMTSPSSERPTRERTSYRSSGASAPDVVLLDMRLPKVDGLACLDLIRKHHPSVKVVMFSATTDAERDPSPVSSASSPAPTRAPAPIRNLRVFEITDPALDANSFEACATCAHHLVVELQLTPSLKDASCVSDPPVILRLTGSGSLTQALDCDPAKSRLEDEIATGCTPAYTENNGTFCPEHNVLWSTPQPWPCVRVDTGAPPNKIAAGLNLRILGDEKAKTCTSPNNWSNYPNISQSDPRIVQVFLTQFGSFAGRGRAPSP